MFRLKFLFSTIMAAATLAYAPVAAHSSDSSSSSDNVLYGQWPIVGQDYGNLGNAPAKINAVNAMGLLQPTSQNFFFFTDGYQDSRIVTGQPAVADHIAYFGNTGGFIYAIDTKKGSLIWKTVNLGNEFLTTPVITKKFIYIAGSSIFGIFTQPVVKMFCINRKKGTVIWSTPVSPQSGEVAGVSDFTGDVTVVDDLAIVGVANTQNLIPGVTDYIARGSIVAFDRHTGDEVWRYWTTSDQLQSDAKYGAGVGVWSSAGVDLKRKTIYMGTGQNFETPVTPDEDSLLALNYKTGKLIWFKQMSINDVWAPFTTPYGPDSDVGTHTNLFTLKVPGRGHVDYLGVGDKAGRYYIIERDGYKHSHLPHKSPPIVATLFLDQASTEGTIQSTATIDEKKGILYVASGALNNTDDENVRVTMNGGPLIPGAAEDFSVFQSYIVPKIAAYDLVKLVQGQTAQEALIWEYKSVLDTHNRGQVYGPLVKSNDAIFYTTGYGLVRALNANFGTPIGEVIPVALGAPIFGGVTIVGKQMLVPTVIGIASYKLP